VTFVSAGSGHSLALKSDGSVWAWGANGSGQLGNSTPVRSVVPVQVNGWADVIAVVAGDYHSMVLKADGSVWAWGSNGSGQLGSNTTTGSVTPVQVNGLTNVVAVAAGSSHSLASKSDGSVWAWGANWSGQLGNNTTTESPTPIQVSIVGGVSKIAAGSSHTIVLKEDGTLTSWGDGSFGQLGIGIGGSSSIASPVRGFNLLIGAPTVSIISPANDATAVLGQVIHFQVSTGATAGTVTEVNFFNEGTKIGTSTVTPFDWAWTPNTWGDFQITAVATDSSGSTSLRSDIVAIHVAYDSDNSGLGDWWELANFGHLGVNPNADPDGDGFTNLQEREQGSDPKNYYNGEAPVLSVLGGDGQTGAPGTILPQSFAIKITNSDGTPLVNAPVRFGPVQGGGSLSASEYGSTTAQLLNLRTGPGGAVSVWHILPDIPSATVFVAASAGLGAATAQITFSAHTSTTSTTAPAAPGRPVISLQNEETEALVEWVDKSSNETAFYVERTEDGVNWTRRATLPPNTTAWTDHELTPGWAYVYRVVAHN
ncbi:MAG TPA: Ig-like domain-containing protein, partial [Chthoniobacterales bacterium]